MKKIDLNSVQGINYQKLEDLLAVQAWEEASKFTHQLMFQLVGKIEDDDWLSAEEIENFSCTDLQIIDQLWCQYSDQQFGFSVQNQIYQNIKQKLNDDDFLTWQAFGVDVGWRIFDEWLYYRNLSDLHYAVSLQGHFPRTFSLKLATEGFDDFFREGWFGKFWLPTPVLLSRFDQCGG